MTAEPIELHQPRRESEEYNKLVLTMAMAELGCRAQLIQKLTRSGMPTIRWMIAKVGGVERDLGGRQPRSIGSILEVHSRQIEASIFLATYVRVLAYRDTISDDVDIQAFVYGLRAMKSACKDGEMTPDHAHMVAVAFHQGEVSRKTCDQCPSQFAATATIGACPFCTAGASIRDNVALPGARKPLTSSTSVAKTRAASRMPVTSEFEETTRASDQLGTMKATIALAEIGVRPQMIQRMTAAGIPTIRGILALLGKTEKDRGGRSPRAITSLLEHVPRHIQASHFLRTYINVLAHYGGGRGVVHVDAFIRSMMLTWSDLNCRAEDFHPDHGHLVASLYHSGEVHLKRCNVCSSQYLAGQNVQVIRSHVTVGDCPQCRNLKIMETGRAVVKIPDVREQRRLFERLTQA